MRKTDATQSKAPDVMSAEDFLAKLRAGTRETHIIRVRDVEVPIRILSLDETNQIRREAITKTLAAGGDETDRDIFIQKATLAKATTMRGSIPAIHSKIWEQVSSDEVSAMWDEYIKAMDDVNPRAEQIPDEQFKALVVAAKKNSISARDCSLAQLRAIFSDWQAMIQKQDKASSHTAS